MTQLPALEPGKYYHIYNRGTNGENLFIEERNYRYFLLLYAKYIEPIAITFAYCLLRNHFHLLVRIKSDAASLASNQFAKLFNAYAKAINKGYQRTGSLFEHPFHRIEVTSDIYFVRLIVYIHRNPQKHGFTQNFQDWPYSSYHGLLSSQPTHLQRDLVLDWFGNPDTFIATHQIDPNEHDLMPVMLEEEI
jgi:REP element-mobilizing transposase RayT